MRGTSAESLSKDQAMEEQNEYFQSLDAHDHLLHAQAKVCCVCVCVGVCVCVCVRERERERERDLLDAHDHPQRGEARVGGWVAGWLGGWVGGWVRESERERERERGRERVIRCPRSS